jgi:hypothetical protein
MANHLPPTLDPVVPAPGQVPGQLIPDPAVPALGLMPGQARQALPASTNRITTCSILYGDAFKDPCKGSYERIMARFDAAHQDAPTAVELYDQVVNLGIVPQAYLFCAHSAQGPRIYCAHSPSKYRSALDGMVTAWDNQSFAFLGEAVQGMVSIINFLEIAFEAITVWTKSVAYILQHLPELDPVLPPSLPDTDDPNMEEITMRWMIYLLAGYTPLFLSASGYTPRQAWDLLYPTIQQRQEVNSCAPLLCWLQVASTGGPLPNNPLAMGPTLLTIALYPPPADEHLLLHRHEFVRQLLPGLTKPPPKHWKWP